MIISPYQKPFRGLQLNKAHPLARGLVGCWVMNEGSGNKIYDLSGNGNEGIFQGTAPSWTAGKFGLAILLPGTDEYIEIGSSSSLLSPTITDEFTISVWVNPTTITASSTAEDHIVSTSFAVMRFQVSDDLELYFWGDDNAPNGAITVSDIWSINTWYYIVFVFDGANAKVYKDGSLKYSNNVWSGEGVGTGAQVGDKVHIGARNGTEFLEGLVSNVSIFNRALAASEIAWLHREPYAMIEPYIDPAMLYVVTAEGISIPVVMQQMNQFNGGQPIL